MLANLNLGLFNEHSYTEDEDLKSFATQTIYDDPRLDPKVPFERSGPNIPPTDLFISYSHYSEYWMVPCCTINIHYSQFYPDSFIIIRVFTPTMRTDSWQCFRWALVNNLIHSGCSIPLICVNEFWLTVLFCWKMMGASIGKRTMIKPEVLLLEADLLEIGDDCHIEEEATLMCHKFNNGALELGKVVIPSKTYVGNRAVIFPGSKILDENIQMLPLPNVSID